MNEDLNLRDVIQEEYDCLLGLSACMHSVLENVDFLPAAVSLQRVITYLDASAAMLAYAKDEVLRAEDEKAQWDSVILLERLKKFRQ
jgi:hypothetical protein